MRKQLLTYTLSLGLVFSLLGSVAQAQDVPRPDKRGNYASNSGPVSSNVRFGGTLWKVRHKLPVREDGNLKGKILFYLNPGDTIAAFIGMGGSDEVLRNIPDSKGRMWMRVVLPAKYGSGNSGYVRAHSYYIRPVLASGVKDDTPEIADSEETGGDSAPASGKKTVQGSELAGVGGVTQITSGAGKVVDKVKINDEASESAHGLAGKDTELIGIRTESTR